MFTRVLLASLAARRVRLGLGVLAVTVGVAAAVALAALALESGDDFARTLRAAGPNFVVLPAGAGWGGGPEGAEVRVPRAGATLPVSVVADLKRSFWKNNVLDAAPERTVVGRIAGVPALITVLPPTITLSTTWNLTWSPTFACFELFVRPCPYLVADLSKCLLRYTRRNSSYGFDQVYLLLNASFYSTVCSTSSQVAN